MATARITDALVKALPVPAESWTVTYDAHDPDGKGVDTHVRGFGCRVTSGGVRSFVLRYRTRGTGKDRLLTIGRYPDWSVAAARQEARALRQRVDRGEDPLAEVHELRAAPTVADLAARYIEEWLPKKRPRSQRSDRGMLARDILPAIGHFKVTAVSHADIYNLHARITKRAPCQANRVVALLSKMFALAVRPWGYRSDNPVRGLPLNAEQPRSRFLTPQEIGRLVEALNQYHGRSAAACTKFLLLTGARMGEAINATWAQVDLGAGLWVKPSSHTKQKTEHRVPLSGPARMLLQEIRPADAAPGDYIFPGRLPGEPLSRLRTCWEAVAKQAGLAGVRLHDLRHSYASVLASSGVSLPIIGALLGHTQAATTQRYAHLLDSPLREATERVGAIVAGGKDAEVVRLPKRAG